VAAVYRYWAALVFFAVVVQIGLAGYGAFYVAHKVQDNGVVNEDKFDDGFGAHMGFGYLVVLLGIILLVIALASADRRTLAKKSGLLAGLLIVQVLLAWFGSEVPVIGIFHPLNAVVIFALSGIIAHTAWRGPRATASA
jgi:hypothetical protein